MSNDLNFWTFPTPKNDIQAARSILESTATINLWDGSVRARKTVTATFAWLRFVIQNPDGQGLYIITGKTLDTIISNILLPLQMFLGQDVFSYSTGTRRAYLKGLRGNKKITFFLIGACNEGSETRIQGKTVFCALSDEGSLYPTSFLQMLFSRLSLDDSRMFMTTNPDSKNHYIYKNYIEKKDNPDVSIQYFQFQLLDNPYISDTKKAEFVAMYSGLWKRRYIYGEWVAAEGAIYPQFNEDIHVVDTRPLRNQCQSYYIGVDFGTKNPTVFILIGLTSDKRMIALAEYYWNPNEHGGKEKTTNEFALEMLKFISNNAVTASTIIVDPSASTLILSLRNALKNGNKNTSVILGDNSVDAGIATTCNLLENNQILFDRSCKNGTREMQGYSWKKEKPDKVDDHFPDALRYVVNHLFTNAKKKIKHQTTVYYNNHH